ncbi:hypothetical protein ACFX2G_016851 [Malus domestica]
MSAPHRGHSTKPAFSSSTIPNPSSIPLTPTLSPPSARSHSFSSTSSSSKSWLSPSPEPKSQSGRGLINLDSIELHRYPPLDFNPFSSSTHAEEEARPPPSSVPQSKLAGIESKLQSSKTEDLKPWVCSKVESLLPKQLGGIFSLPR